MSLDSRRIIFFFPYRGIGGVPVLFLRIAEYMSRVKQYKLFFVDYPDGYMAKNLKQESGIGLIPYDCNEDILFSDNDIVIFQSMPLFLMPQNLIFNHKTILVFWNLHPFNLFGHAIKIDQFKNLVVKNILLVLLRLFFYDTQKQLVWLFNKNKSLFFMDGENLRQTERLVGVKVENPIYLPLMLQVFDNIKEGCAVGDAIKCLWIGRVADFKVHILLYTIRRLDKYARANNKKIIFTVIGDGDCIEYLQGSLSEVSIEIQYKNYIEPSLIKEYLTDADICFGMGTAAIDSAKYGVPTVLLDFSYKNIDGDYLYRWLFETESFDLGRNIEDVHFEKNNNTLEQMMDGLAFDYKTISVKTHGYVKSNFDIEQNISKFVSLLENASMRYVDIPKSFFDMNIFHRILRRQRYYR